MEQQPRQAMVVYGGFNCPFCFASHEHLHAHDRFDQVEWRLIQPAPEINSQTTTFPEQYGIELQRLSRDNLEYRYNLATNAP